MNADWWLVIVTGALAFFTGALWIFTALMRRSTRDIAKASIRRPWLFINSTGSIQLGTITGIPGKNNFMQYDFYNHGEAPAMVEAIFAELIIGPEIPENPAPARLQRLVQSFVLGPSSAPNSATGSEVLILPRDPPLYIQTEEPVTFWVKIKYKGIGTPNRETSAMWRYDKQYNVFVNHGGERYNYLT